MCNCFALNVLHFRRSNCFAQKSWTCIALLGSTMHCVAPLCNTIVLHYCVAQYMFNCNTIELQTCNCVGLRRGQALLLHYYVQMCNTLYVLYLTQLHYIHAIVYNCVGLCTYVQLCWSVVAGRQLGESCCRCKCLQSSTTSSAIECNAIMQHCWHCKAIKKMLQSRPEDALVKLVKLVKLYRLWRPWRLWRLWRLWRIAKNKRNNEIKT